MQLSLTVAINCLGNVSLVKAKQSFPIVKSKNDYDGQESKEDDNGTSRVVIVK